MRDLGILLLAMLAACSEAPKASAIANDASASEAAALTTLDTEAGRYRIELDAKFDPNTLPMNADLKMVDGDIGQYALKLCGLDFANKLRPDRCEIFVQPDKSGLLIGYAVLQQGQGVRMDTAIETDRQRSGLGCWINGDLVNTDYENPEAKLDISKSFQSRMSYAAWEKSPGNWMVSSGDGDVDEQGARGMWYIKRASNKLRISQERWSYCYSDSNIYIDEVFSHAATLTRVGN